MTRVRGGGNGGGGDGGDSGRDGDLGRGSLDASARGATCGRHSDRSRHGGDARGATTRAAQQLRLALVPHPVRHQGRRV